MLTIGFGEVLLLALIGALVVAFVFRIVEEIFRHFKR